MPVRLRRKVHVCWLLAWFSAALIGGITLSLIIHKAIFASPQVLILAGVLLLPALKNRAALLVALMISAGLLMGLWRGTNERMALAGYSSYIAQHVQLRGIVSDDVTYKNSEEGLKLTHVEVNNQKLNGEVWAGVTSNLDLKRKDSVIISGKLQPGFGNFAASMSYASLVRAERFANADVVRDIRDSFSNGLKRAVPQPEADLGIGYLTGQHNELSPDLVKQLQFVGLIHLVIAGGYNVTILVRFARRAFGKISKYLALIAASSILIALTVVAGFGAPMARTAIVTGLSLWAWYYGLKIHPLVLLPVSAAITAIISPTFVWGDVGWYLTFIAYGGLIILGPMIKKWLWKNETEGTLKQIFVDTLSVQIVTMPLLAFAFGQYSIYGLPANLLVLPLMPLTMLAAAIAGFGGTIFPAPIAHIIGWPAAQLLGYTDRVTVGLANASGAQTAAVFHASALVASYLTVLLFIYVLWRKTHYNFRMENIVE